MAASPEAGSVAERVSEIAADIYAAADIAEAKAFTKAKGDCEALLPASVYIVAREDPERKLLECYLEALKQADIAREGELLDAARRRAEAYAAAVRDAGVEAWLESFKSSGMIALITNIHNPNRSEEADRASEQEVALTRRAADVEEAAINTWLEYRHFCDNEALKRLATQEYVVGAHRRELSECKRGADQLAARILAGTSTLGDAANEREWRIV